MLDCQCGQYSNGPGSALIRVNPRTAHVTCVIPPFRNWCVRRRSFVSSALATYTGERIDDQDRFTSAAAVVRGTRVLFAVCFREPWPTLRTPSHRCTRRSAIHRHQKHRKASYVQ